MIKNYIISLKEFWPYYVREHRQSGTRWLHFIGNTNLFIWLILALLRWSWTYIVIAIVSSYMLAWIGHFFFEHIDPLLSSIRCIVLLATG